ncbi:DUF5676 family membrane protein [Microvirga sp. ACRRW]|uniref:DUF5676 family membrane protein n=1 Tax=Microvirga sp. ACRRW TaxID=2918205 RepID=UPI001EF61D48|nr:DUF5676 family membrane protein [Microvirga sp. ACRRW]MCG7392938.1 DUF5676 family membrane protein [Microvirga sp. ACRRW]
MPVSTIETMPSSSQTRGTSMNLVATGWALTSALVGLFVICYLLSFVWPTSGLAHGWVSLLATQPDNFVRTFVEGVVGSTAAAWLAAVLFVPVYNRMIGR